MEIIDCLKHDGKVTDTLKEKILSYCSHIFTINQTDAHKENDSLGLDVKQMWAFVSSTLNIFTHKAALKSQLHKNMRKSSSKQTSLHNQGHLENLDKK